jgi:hypothetical protein
MINPARLAKNIDRIRFYIDVNVIERYQRVLVDVVMHDVCEPFDLLFCASGKPSSVTDENIWQNLGHILLMDRMLEAWNATWVSMISGFVIRPQFMDIEHSTDSNLQSIRDNSGCKHAVRLHVNDGFPGQHRIVSIWKQQLKGWKIDITDNLQSSYAVLIPTYNSSMGETKYDIIMADLPIPDNVHALPPMRPQLIGSIVENIFYQSPKTLCLIRRSEQHCPPNHNLYISTIPHSCTEPTFLGINGAICVDMTRLHLLTFHNVNYQLVPAIAGCFLKDFDYPLSHMPFIITHGMSDDNGFTTFEDGPDATVLIKTKYETFCVDVTSKHMVDGLLWLPMCKVAPEPKQ